MKFKLVRQQDESDCGVACLSMILQHYGSYIPISKLRKISGTDNEGTSALGLKECVENFNIECVAIKTDSHVWSNKDLILPLVAHCVVDNKFLHYVVIYKKKNNLLYIADPSKGLLKLTIKEFEAQWTGIILLMSPNDDYKALKEKNEQKNRYIRILLNQKKTIFYTVMFSFMITIFGIVSSYYFQLIIDYFIPDKKTSMFNIVSVGFFLIYLLQALFEYFQGYFLVILGQKMSLSVMLKYYKHVLNLPLSFYDTRKSGEIVSRFLDANKIIDALASATLSIFIDVVMVLIIGITLFIQNISLFFVALATIPFYVLLISLGIKPIDQANEEEMHDNAKVNSSIIESLNGIETIKAYNGESEIYNKVEKQFTRFMKKNLKRNNLDTIQRSIKHAIQLSSTMIILWVGSYYVMDGRISLGQLITFNALLVFFMNPLQNIINLQAKIQTAQVANRRINEIFNIDKEDRKLGLKVPSVLKDELLIKNLSFSYGYKNPILKNITTSFTSGEKIALVGVSGSGKSTLAKLLVNFYTPSQGEIIYDCKNIKNINLYALRNHVTYVPQDSFFFNGTILENLKLGASNEYDLDRIIEVCELVKIIDFINQLPLKFDTIIEEGGANLSGGQKQRLALARAVLKNSDFLILDEATSSLDTMLEYDIIQNLSKLSSQTILFITHHLSVAKISNKVLVLNQGELVEQGTHDDLRFGGGIYQKMWEISDESL